MHVQQNSGRQYGKAACPLSNDTAVNKLGTTQSHARFVADFRLSLSCRMQSCRLSVSISATFSAEMPHFLPLSFSSSAKRFSSAATLSASPLLLSPPAPLSPSICPSSARALDHTSLCSR